MSLGISKLILAMGAVQRLPQGSLRRAARGRRLVKVESAEMHVFDFRPAETHSPDVAAELLTGALERCFLPGAGNVGALVADELHSFCVFPDFPVRQGVEVGARGTYVTSFEYEAQSNLHFLACELVGAAAVADYVHGAGRRKVTSEELQSTAWRAQQFYLSRFDRREEWIDYFARLRAPQ